MEPKRTLRVLVVEDDADLRASVAELLESEGHACTQARDVAGARDRLNDADLVLLDLHLPDGPVEPFLAELRARGKTVLLFSADATPKSREMAERWTMPLVMKPFDIDELMATIERTAAVHARD